MSSTDGSVTSTFWKRRAKARSFSKMPRNSWKVVEPMQRISPEDRTGLSRLEASITPPDAAPAPMMVWISSMNSTACGRLRNSLSKALKRFSKSPRYLVPASKAPRSRE